MCQLSKRTILVSMEISQMPCTAALPNYGENILTERVPGCESQFASGHKCYCVRALILLQQAALLSISAVTVSDYNTAA